MQQLPSSIYITKLYVKEKKYWIEGVYSSDYKEMEWEISLEENRREKRLFPALFEQKEGHFRLVFPLSFEKKENQLTSGYYKLWLINRKTNEKQLIPLAKSLLPTSLSPRILGLKENPKRGAEQAVALKHISIQYLDRDRYRSCWYHITPLIFLAEWKWCLHVQATKQIAWFMKGRKIFLK